VRGVPAVRIGHNGDDDGGDYCQYPKGWNWNGNGVDHDFGKWDHSWTGSPGQLLKILLPTTVRRKAARQAMPLSFVPRFEDETRCDKTDSGDVVAEPTRALGASVSTTNPQGRCFLC